MPEQPEVRFVRGDLTTVDTMTRACVAQAAAVIIDGRDDNETLAIALAVDHANPEVHMVVVLREMNRREQLRYVNPRIQCVQWHVPNLVTGRVVVSPGGIPRSRPGRPSTTSRSSGSMKRIWRRLGGSADSSPSGAISSVCSVRSAPGAA